MNMAALWKLPVIYVCENNLYNEYTHYRETTAGEIRLRPEAFGIRTEIVDGQDVMRVYSTMIPLVERARNGAGPAFLQCNTYRFHGHYVGDIDRAYYRSKQEEEEWKSLRDPIKLTAERLITRKITVQEDLDSIRGEVQAEIDAGVKFAINAPFPALTEVDQHVYARND
jgi:pyruvate dehydrogenase E1 component alpha subunit